jgi:large repetitive protein
MIHKNSPFSGWRPALLVLLLMMVVAVVPVSAALANTAWPKFQQNTGNTGLSPNNGPQTNTLAWTYYSAPNSSNSQGITGQPTIGSDGTIYFGGAGLNLVALKPDGTEKWTFLPGTVPINGQLQASPAIGSDGTIYFGTTLPDSHIYALNPDGTQKWVSSGDQGSGYSLSSVAIGTDGTLYAGDYGGNLNAFNSDGTLKWAFIVRPGFTYPVQGTPAIAPDGTIYIGGGAAGKTDNSIFAVNPDGTMKWRAGPVNKFATDRSIVIGSDGTIYARPATTTIGYLYALNPDGTTKWSVSGFWYWPSASPALGPDGTIYVSEAKAMDAFTTDGTKKWSYGVSSNIYYAPAVGADGTIYFGCDNSILYALNPDGTEKWQYTLGGGPRGAPSIGPDGSLYIVAYDNKLYAFRDPVAQPVAGFSATPLTGPAPLAVQFTDASTSSEKLTYAWDFENDGVVDNTDKSPAHSYDTPGKYSVNLTVTNSGGSNSMVKTEYITVDEGTTPAPEFPTMALPAALIVGMLGTVLFIRRTKEY